MKFSDLNLAEPLMRAIDAAGYTDPTPIQAQAIPPIMAKKDVLGLAQTGTGKTAAFALPILHRLLESPPHLVNGHRMVGARALVLSPTRELAQQVHESFQKYGRFTNLRSVAVVGGVHQFSQVQAIKAGVDILIATPGRLLDLYQQRHVRLTFVEIAVLDEADRMLDIGFLPDILKILAHVPEDRQTLLFSATMPPAIRSLANEALRHPVKVQVAPLSSAAPTVEHWVHYVDSTEKLSLLTFLLREAPKDRTLVFTRSKRGADQLAKQLRQSGIKALAMHGDMEQEYRTRALAAFRSATSPVLVATDVAARGLHVDDIATVINFDLTNEPEVYVHRVGRTGRAGAEGKAISFCTARERHLLAAIQQLINTPFKRAGGDDVPVPAEPAARGAGGRQGSRSAGGRDRHETSRSSHAHHEGHRSDHAVRSRGGSHPEPRAAHADHGHSSGSADHPAKADHDSRPAPRVAAGGRRRRRGRGGPKRAGSA